MCRVPRDGVSVELSACTASSSTNNVNESKVSKASDVELMSRARRDTIPSLPSATLAQSGSSLSKAHDHTTIDGAKATHVYY